MEKGTHLYGNVANEETQVATLQARSSKRTGLKSILIYALVAIAVALAGCDGSAPATRDDNHPPTAALSRNVVLGTVTPLPSKASPVAPTMDETASAQVTQNTAYAQAGSLPVSSRYFYFNATSHSISAFADAFVGFGEVASLGYPLTEAFVEQSTLDGEWYWVQMFEKAQLEYHPDETPNNRYQMTPLGTWRFITLYPGDAPAQKTVPGKGSYTFAETKHTVKGAFLEYWHNNGEIRRFGFPVSESFEEKSDADGQTYVVQYFERAVMEYHPKLKKTDQVQLTALGRMKLALVWPSGAPAGASNPIPSPTVNAGATALAISNATALVELTQQARGTATAVAISNSSAIGGANFTSGGLGLTREQWEQKHGPPGRAGIFGIFYGEDERYDVLYNSPDDFSTDGVRVHWLSRYFRQGPVRYKDALLESQKLIPFGAKNTGHYEDTDTQGVTFVVDTYWSAALSSLYKSSTSSKGYVMDPWHGEKPGTFFIIFAEYPDKGNKIPSFDILLGKEH